MVCTAPVCLNSGGRSAVMTIKGNFFLEASIIAGKKLAAAVPEVQINTAGFLVAAAITHGVKSQAPLIKMHKTFDFLVLGQGYDQG